jgi:hypothetical protein
VLFSRLEKSFLLYFKFFFFSGAVIFIIAFFGCCGAWRESPWMIYTYAALLCVILTGRDEYRVFVRGLQQGDVVYFG